MAQYALHEVQRRLEKHKLFTQDIAQAFRETFLAVDDSLRDEIFIEPLYAGTTACVALLQDNKLVLANALLAGLLNVIPNVGPTISTVFPMAVAILDAPWKAAAVLGSYILIQNLESYLITPSVMHHQVKLLPGLTLAAQFIFTVVFGPIGLLMALPLAVVFQVLIREVLIHDVLDRWKSKRLTT